MSYVDGSAWCDCPGLGDDEELTAKQATKKLRALLDDVSDEEKKLARLISTAREQRAYLLQLATAKPVKTKRFNWPLWVGTAGLAGTGYLLWKRGGGRRR